jgi:hypothetical protein
VSVLRTDKGTCHRPRAAVEGGLGAHPRGTLTELPTAQPGGAAPAAQVMRTTSRRYVDAGLLTGSLGLRDLADRRVVHLGAPACEVVHGLKPPTGWTGLPVHPKLRTGMPPSGTLQVAGAAQQDGSAEAAG